MNSGRLFHAHGPATAKARSPSDERRVAGTIRANDGATLYFSNRLNDILLPGRRAMKTIVHQNAQLVSYRPTFRNTEPM